MPQIKGKWLEYIIGEEEGGCLLQEVLKEKLLISRRMVNRLTRKEGIKLNGRNPYLKRMVKPGDKIQILVEGGAKSSNLIPEDISFDILYEDEAIIVVNKPPNLMVHPVKLGQSGTLANGLLYHWEKKGVTPGVHPIHRLDKDTSGAILIAKSGYLHQLLDRQLKEGEIIRVYTAVAEGQFLEKKGTITYPIARSTEHPIKRIVSSTGDEAITHYQVVEQYGQGALLRLQLETGRTHQIRIHLSHLGHPLFGDTLYGGRTEWIDRQALHSQSIRFFHPVSKKEMLFEAPLPKDIVQLIENLQKAR
ncbi:RluA family pseudouridine synthase [Microaerobacter geothermalis]|uniref:RluA family pseudouridine synthase n=1 Tax=Microaerobacter geothermalis TaxID=674972 RepID=UPI001F1616A7|nr:RluA family pseudouridine synthase [Microaerobacter geothermalis]MCF6093723.1 RluA family pseudouridine synthase [Microaerobacter geothermalis]